MEYDYIVIAFIHNTSNGHYASLKVVPKGPIC